MMSTFLENYFEIKTSAKKSPTAKCDKICEKELKIW